ncbi:UNVERIFIED_CONTAM: hypothetical protein ABID98_005569 [Brevibacillus sp. OAP136]
MTLGQWALLLLIYGCCTVYYVRWERQRRR